MPIEAAKALTDGGTISPITSSKLLKDFVYDFLTGATAGFAAGSITGVSDVVAGPLPVVFGVANAAIAAIVRVTLRWATS